MESQQISEILMFSFGFTILGIFLLAAVYMIYYEKLKSMEVLRTKVKKSVDAIESIIMACKVIKDLKFNSITAEGYALIRQDRQRAISLLKALEQKEISAESDGNEITHNKLNQKCATVRKSEHLELIGDHKLVESNKNK